MEEIRIGDICKVIDTKQIYASYSNFAIKAGHTDIKVNKYVTKENYKSTQDKVVRVLYIGPPKDKSKNDIAIVETIDNAVYLKFVIGIDSLEITYIESPSGIFAKEYIMGKSLTHMIPDEYVTETLIDAIILKNPMDIEFIKAELLTDKHFIKILLKDGGLLGLIPIERRTLGLCKVAIENEEYAEKFIPKKLKRFMVWNGEYY